MGDTASPYIFFFFNDTATTEIYTLSLHDALPICPTADVVAFEQYSKAKTLMLVAGAGGASESRSEEHTSELQSRFDLVCRLLLEKKKQKKFKSTLPLRSVAITYTSCKSNMHLSLP